MFYCFYICPIYKGDSFLGAPGDFSYDDSQGTQQTAETQQSFQGVFTENMGGNEAVIGDQSGEGVGNPGLSGTDRTTPPDIKYEVTPINYLKGDDVELIEIGEDDDI